MIELLMAGRPTTPTMKWAALVGLLLAIVLPAVGTAATTGRSALVYSPASVTRAFNTHGIKVYNAAVGTSSPVTTLASRKAHDGWRVGIYVYATIPSATASYKENLAAWKRSGFASTRVNNVVVVVVPNGKTLARKGKAFAMPALVRTAIADFKK
jgi:hypothetical protein